MLTFADAYELRPKPLEIKYEIIKGSLSFCERWLNQLGKDYHVDVLQAFSDMERPDEIVMILALISKTRK